MSYVAVTRVDVTPSTEGSWTDVDLSSYIPSGAVGVMFAVATPNGTTFYRAACRKNGSTDDRHENAVRDDTNESIMCCGVDANRICELWVSSSNNFTIYLDGYFIDDVVFNTNGTTINVTTSYADYDLGINDGAKGAIVEIVNSNTSTGYTYKIRKNGSTDDVSHSIDYVVKICAFVGVDDNEIFEASVNNVTYVDMWILGYFKSNWVFETNLVDISLSSTGVYRDLTALPNTYGTPSSGIILVKATSDSYSFDLRKNGSSNTNYDLFRQLTDWRIIECDTSGIIEGKISSVNVDFFRQGYWHLDQTLSLTGIASTAAIGSLTLAPGNVNLALTGIPSGAQIGTLTMVPGDVNLTLTGIASGVQFGTLTLVNGEAVLALTGIPSTVQFGTLTLVPGPAVMELSGIPPGTQFGTLTLVPGEVILALPGIASTVQFGELTLAFDDLILSLTGIPSGVVIGDLALISSLVHVKVSGVWKAAIVYAKVGGEWQDISIIKGKVTEIWK